jgi:hypothetical protein
MFMARQNVPADISSHTPGTPKGEECVRRHGKEPGRSNQQPSRTARDATSINARDREPIDPRMPEMPPA